MRACDRALAVRYPLWPGRLSYRMRPYDMLADRRRWFWQKAQRCGFPAGTSPEHIAAITEAAVRAATFESRWDLEP